MAENKNEFIGLKTKAVKAPDPNIGVDLDNTLETNILEGAQVDKVDLNYLQNFLNISQDREQIYELIDTMTQDSKVAAVLETYVEDVCETNDRGQIVWCESSDENITKMVSYLLDTMNVDKHIYSWVYCLIKYGDVYLKLFRQSDYQDDDLFNKEEVELKQTLTEAKKDPSKETLKEDVIINAHSVNDHYVHYVEKVANPGEMYELTRQGKTMGYIKAPVDVVDTLALNNGEIDTTRDSYTNWMYRVKERDVTVYQATDFVHAALEDNTSRTSEEVTIFRDDEDYDSNANGLTYTVKRGSSLFSNLFKTWRELSLLENAILLNRITKSSTTRIVQVEVGDMPQPKVIDTMQRMKSLVEQKSSIETNKKMTQYINPGPIENNIYVPTHGGQGAVTLETLGGQDADVKSLADLDHFLDDFYGSLRVPKQFFGITDDSAGFNGGSSLAIISSRYGKAVKRIQNTILQALTDAINLYLIDKGLLTYVNNFTLRMTTPVTQEEIDKREASANQIRNIADIQNLLGDMEDQVLKLKILKSLLPTVVSDDDILQCVQDQIDLLEQAKEEEISEDEDFEDEDFGDEGEGLHRIDLGNEDFSEPNFEDSDLGDEDLPTPEETGAGLPKEESGTLNDSLELPSFEALNEDAF